MKVSMIFFAGSGALMLFSLGYHIIAGVKAQTPTQKTVVLTDAIKLCMIALALLICGALTLGGNR